MQSVPLRAARFATIPMVITIAGQDPRHLCMDEGICAS
jgi:hypothetical protein